MKYYMWGGGNITVKDKIDQLNNATEYHVGDTFIIGQNFRVLTGSVGWSGKKIYIPIQLDKPLGSDITKWDLTLSGTCYFLTNNSITTWSYTTNKPELLNINADRMCLTILIEKSTAWFGFNDGLVGLRCDYGLITFS